MGGARIYDTNKRYFGQQRRAGKRQHVGVLARDGHHEGSKHGSCSDSKSYTGSRNSKHEGNKHGSCSHSSDNGENSLKEIGVNWVLVTSFLLTMT